MPELSALSREITFSGTAEAVEAALKTLAPELGFSFAPAGDGEWRVSAGDWLATNPNDLRWSARVALEGGALRLEASVRAFPWSRPRARRIAAHRLGQLADHLAGRLGLAPRRDVAPHDRAPFRIGGDSAAHCLAFAGHVVQMAATMAFVMAAVTLAAWVVVGRAAAELEARAPILESLGAPVLPPKHDLASFTAGRRLAAAALLAMPCAFFLGLVHTLASVAGELWRRASRLPIAFAIFSGAVSVLAFATALGPLLGAPLGLLVPVAARVGASLAWGLRRERLLDAPEPPSKAPWLRIAGAILALMVVAAFLPAPRTGREFRDHLAIFRDRYLLVHGPGRWFAETYYRNTLYAAEPVKQAFDGRADEPYHKEAPLALVVPPNPTAAAILRSLDFVVKESTAPEPGFDLVVGEGGLAPPATSDPKAWREAIADESAKRFRGRWLLELVRTGWMSIYFAGPLFGVALAMAPLAALAGLLYRRLPAPKGHGVVAATFVVTVVALAWVWTGNAAQLGELAALRKADAAALGRALSSPYDAVRHEAAVRLFKMEQSPGAEPLLLPAADPDPRVRTWVLAALGRTRDRRAAPLLIGATRDPDLLVRYRAVEGLGFLEQGRGPAADPGVVRVLEGVLRDGTWYEAVYALGALRRIDPNR
jgi:hypothetical protein